MFRRTAHRGVALLAIVVTLVLIGAQPAAAADRTAMDRFASFWGAVLNTVPGAQAALDRLTVLFSSSSSEPQQNVDRGFGIDPNGVVLYTQPSAPPSAHVQN